NAVERALMFHRSGPLAVSEPAVDWDLPDHSDQPDSSGWTALVPPNEVADEAVELRIPLGLSLAEVERRYMEATLRNHSTDYGTLATRLGISRKTLWKKRLEFEP